MLASRSRESLILIALLSVASCTQSSGPALPPLLQPQQSLSPNNCYVVKIAPTTVQAAITFYGWPDNAPPGNGIKHPVLHRHAGGDGTYCNPTTFATERKNNKTIPYGIKIYVPFLKQYFIREDLCTTSGGSQGSGSNGCYKLWFDLWIGGNAHSKKSAVFKCERALTPNKEVSVILYPRDGLPVANPGPIYRNKPAPNGTCDGQAEGGSMRSTTLPN
ncbi:MAG: hypothetical protein WA814_08025 [Candidatus Baltobacteraceae bacterium]